MPPPSISLINKNGVPVDFQSMPSVGQKTAGESLPVVSAAGVDPTQFFVPVPKFDPTNPASITATAVLVVPYNIQRRYLKIINNGPVDVELWTGHAPASADIVNQTIRRGEVIYANGGGLVEVGERISAIYATASDASGLVVLEG